MKALVVGCGSIGRRRAKILLAQGHDVLLYDRDTGAAVSACAALTGKGHGKVEAHVSGDLAMSPYDVALICTPPDSGRPEQIQRCLEMGVRGLYVEKPMALDRSDVDEIAGMFGVSGIGLDEMNVSTVTFRNSGVITMGACNLRFCGGISGLAKITKPWRMARFTMRQAAKHWSPTHTPISLILDSIHELDLAAHLQGPIESIRGYSELDAAEVSVHHVGGGLSHIFLDRTTSPPLREVQVLRKGDYDSLSLRPDDGMYEREMAHFMECVEKGEQTCNPLRAAAEVCARALEVA